MMARETSVVLLAPPPPRIGEGTHAGAEGLGCACGPGLWSPACEIWKDWIRLQCCNRGVVNSPINLISDQGQ